MCLGPLKSDDRRYSDSIAKSWEEISSRDLAELSELSGGTLDGRRLRLKVLADTVILDFDSKEILWQDGRNVEQELQVVLLHYIIRAEGKIDGKWISYRDVEGGNLYYSVFHGRALRPLILTFGEEPEKLVNAGLRLGGTVVQRGDASVDLHFFPFALVNVTVWKGDEEVPSNANILFDSATGRMLPAEDLAHLSADLVHALILASKQ